MLPCLTQSLFGELSPTDREEQEGKPNLHSMGLRLPWTSGPLPCLAGVWVCVEPEADWGRPIMHPPSGRTAEFAHTSLAKAPQGIQRAKLWTVRQALKLPLLSCTVCAHKDVCVYEHVCV